MAGRSIAQLSQGTSLEDFVLKLLAEPMTRAPGAAFSYSGTSMQVAGRMLERAAKKPFATLFSERLATPLGITTAKFGSPRTWGSGQVPFVAGGMAMSLDDYRRFLVMMLDNGQVGGQRILSQASIAAMETNMIAGIQLGYRPNAAGPDAGYGLGVWCEDIDSSGRCGLVSSAGAVGAYPLGATEKWVAQAFS